MRKSVRLLLVGGLIVFVIGELVGRYYGLTSFPLFIPDPDFEFIAAPNQDVRIYRHHFVTNQYSQRSKPYQQSDTLVYLLIGDSIVFGGNLIDQDSLASSILERKLQHQTGKPIRVLNIASKSWQPDNAAAYIRKYGHFSADKMVLVVSSHDAFAAMTFKFKVEPVANANLAWSVLLDKGWAATAPKLGIAPAALDTTGLNLPKPDKITHRWPFNSGFDAFRRLADSLHIPLAIYHHKTTGEIQTGKLDMGGVDIQLYCKENHIRLVEGKETPALYEDYIHFNERGQRFLSDQLYPFMLGKK